MERLSSEEMESVTRVQIPHSSACVSLGTNVLGEGMNPFSLLELWVNDNADYSL